MLLSITAVVYALYLSGTTALPAMSYQKFEKMAQVPAGWILDSGLSSKSTSETFELKIHLSQPNLAALERKALEISTPEHPSYGQHLSAQQLREMTKPSTKSVGAVQSWLANAGLAAKTTVDNDWVLVKVTVPEAEALLQTKYNVYQHDETGFSALRTTEYSLPAALHQHIDMIQPTTYFGTGRGAMKTVSKPISSQNIAAASCSSSITPTCLANLYKFSDFTLTNASGNALGVNGYLEEYAQNSDLKSFLTKYAKSAAGSTFTCQPVNGGKCTQGSSSDFVEANLDIQYTVGISYPTKNTYYSTAGRPPYNPDDNSGSANNNEPYLDFLKYILAQDTVPQTFTTSYGDDEQSVPESYARQVCSMFMQLGARGSSIMFSSGDSGPGAVCTSNDGKSSTTFIPNFPASCPWITSVGGTVGVSPESAVDFSSGGFSNYFPRPSWQDDVVTTYLKSSSIKKFTKYLNASGRAIPDVAAQGSNFHVIVSGEDQLVSGTSASSPAFAGVISLLNGDRVASGKAPLGFLNPWLYGKAKSGLVDITSGSSSGCSGQISGAGFKAVKGYDAVTGLGTPDFSALRAISKQT